MMGPRMRNWVIKSLMIGSMTAMKLMMMQLQRTKLLNLNPEKGRSEIKEWTLIHLMSDMLARFLLSFRQLTEENH